MTPKQKALNLLEARKKATQGEWVNNMATAMTVIEAHPPQPSWKKPNIDEDLSFTILAANDIESVVKWALGLEKKLQRFITLSNGLSFYVRDEYQKSRLQMTDSVDLVERIEKLYAHQCDAELSAEGEKK